MHHSKSDFEIRILISHQRRTACEALRANRMECEIPLPKKLTKRGMTGSPAPRIRNEGLNLVPDGKTKELAGVYRSMPEFHDIELLVGGETFKAHKLVLAGASPMLYKLFTNGMKESGKSQVELLELRPTVWRAVLSFVYGENVWVPDLENAFEILESARRYQIESLENSVATKLIAAITEENCCFALVHSDKLGSTTVKERALSVVLENFHKLFCQPALSNLDIGLMEQVISSKKLHVRSELEVAHAIALWLARNGFVKMDDVAEFIPDLESQSEAAMHVSLDMSSDNVRQIKNQLSRRIIVANMTEGELKHCAVLCRSLDFDDVYEACVQNIIGQNPKAPPKGAVHRRGRREFVESDFPRINIRVRDMHGNTTVYKMLRDSPLSKLMDAYCGGSGVEIRFLYHGQYFLRDDTANTLQMQDMDVLDAMTHSVM